MEIRKVADRCGSSFLSIELHLGELQHPNKNSRF